MSDNNETYSTNWDNRFMPSNDGWDNDTQSINANGAEGQDDTNQNNTVYSYSSLNDADPSNENRDAKVSVNEDSNTSGLNDAVAVDRVQSQSNQTSVDQSDADPIDYSKVDYSYDAYSTDQYSSAGDSSYGNQLQQTNGYQSYTSQQTNTYPYNQNSSAPIQGGSNTKAVLSLVFGILSIVLCCGCGVGLIFGILGIVMAIASKGDNYGEFSGMALAGLICSVIGLVFSLLTVVFFIFSIVMDA